MNHSNSGAVLLEVIVALAILATAGTMAVVGAAESARSVQHAREREEEIRAASAFLESVSLWPREDLDRRLGRRRQGRWILATSRPTSTLYVVVLADTLTGVRVLETALYRPERVPDESD